MPVAGTTASAASFIASIGINGTAGATAAAQLAYLGIGHLRTNTLSAADLLATGAHGAKIDFILPWYMSSITTSTLAATFAATINPAAMVIEAVEGPNEVNTDPDAFNGLHGAAGVEAEQRLIYAMTKADPKLAGASVYDFSVLQGTPAGAYGGMSSFADFNNVHAYGSPGVPPSWILPYEVAHNTIAGAKPVVITETGAETMAADGVNQAVQARFDIEALLDAWQLGVKRTYLYNLQDWASGANATNFSAHYGLYNTDGTIKQAGTAVHNLTSILSAHGAAAPSTAALPCVLSGLPYYGHQQVFAQAGGVSDIVLWNETEEWNAAAATEIAIPTSKVTLKLAANVLATIGVYDPLLGAAPVRTVTNANSIVTGLSGDPLIVEVSNVHAAPPAAAPAITDTLVLQLSEDAYLGDAMFTVAVDGQRVGSGSVHALYSAGAFDTVSIAGHWGAEPHKIAVAYTNDMSSGRPGQDRNLYVGQISYDDVVVPGSVNAVFPWNATKVFETAVATTPQGGAAFL